MCSKYFTYYIFIFIMFMNYGSVDASVVQYVVAPAAAAAAVAAAAAAAAATVAARTAVELNELCLFGYIKL